MMQNEESYANKNEDLGLGSKVIQENRTRFINKDGTFNVHRKGVWEHGSFSPYHAILNMSWTRFVLGVVGYYLFVNLAFTGLYLLSGSRAFPELYSGSFSDRFGQLFFYSVQVISTLGSSPLHPTSTAGNVLLGIESMIGLFGFAVGSSLMFARFSNPAAKILFSESAVISPYREGKAFMFRIINGRNNELINVSTILTIALTEENGKRTFHPVPLERDSVLVFPLNWTVVHPIVPGSPIYGMSDEDLKSRNVEFLVSITAIDQDLSKTIYIRSSYQHNEVILNAKFSDILELDSSGTVVVDPKRIGEVDKV